MKLQNTPMLVVVLLFLFSSVPLPSCAHKHKGVGVGIGFNWGTVASHQFPPWKVVTMLVDNDILSVKLFNANPEILKAFTGTSIELMIGIPNSQLYLFSEDQAAVAAWVKENITKYDGDVHIKYVAVGNEPLLRAYNGVYDNYITTALFNVINALSATGYGKTIKATVPFNADIYSSPPDNPVPSAGLFRKDVWDIITSIISLLHANDAPFVVNINPFFSLYQDQFFPFNFPFFEGGGGVQHQIMDGGAVYNNVFDANLDTLYWALNKINYTDMNVIVGEVGWPTDGDKHANLDNAKRFNQGLIKHVLSGDGTPARPDQQIKTYLSILIDEDEKDITSGNFERHWGVFKFDGIPKYSLDLSGGLQEYNDLTPVVAVKYMPKIWCVLKVGQEEFSAPAIANNINYAFQLADCTALGDNCSCSQLSSDMKAAYAFNMYYQVNNQLPQACNFSGQAELVSDDPSEGQCQFSIMIAADSGAVGNDPSGQCIILFVVFIVYPCLVIYLA